MLPFKQIQTRPTGDGTVIVTEEYRYKDVVVKRGFISNGASIPRVLWWIYPPFYPDYLTASVVHDKMTNDEHYGKADRYFQQLLKISGVEKHTRRNLVAGVKTWHRMAYKKDNKPRWWLSLILKVKGAK